VHGLGSMLFGLAVQKFLNILNDFFTENFRGIGMWLWCYWKDLDEQELMEII